MRISINLSMYVLALCLFLSPLPVAAEASPSVAAVPSTETTLADFDTFVANFSGRISAVQVVVEPQVAPIVFTKQHDLKLSDPAYLRALTGAYDSGGTKVVIALSGNRLIYTAEGGSPADLIPSLGGEFVHSRTLDSRIAFKTDASKRVSAMTMTNSAGVLEAKRID